MKILKDHEILQHVNLGFEFEFYSRHSKKTLKEFYTKCVDKSVAIPYQVVGQKRIVVSGHSPFKPTSRTFKLEVDGSGGKGMVELVTGAMNYYEAQMVLGATLNFIQRYGWTDQRCGLHFNVSFNEKEMNIPLKISQMNVVKFILGYNEEMVYSLFPNRRNNVYAKSIKNIRLTNPFMPPENVANIENFSNYTYPKTKYYGINFSKLPKNYLEFRYIGGANYEEKYQDIIKIIYESVMYLYNSLKNNNIITSKEREELYNINRKVETIVKCFNDFDNFIYYFPNIKLTVNLSQSPQLIHTYWTQIKPVLFNLLYTNDIEVAEINYDVEVAKFQIANATITNADMSDIEIVQCTLSGTFINCSIYDCEGKDAEFYKCKFYGINKFEQGKIEECIFKSNSSEFYRYWVMNKKYALAGKFIECIIRSPMHYTEFKTIEDKTNVSKAQSFQSEFIVNTLPDLKNKS